MDQAVNILRYGRGSLDAIFSPRAVAVVGATERPSSVGRTVLYNLITNSFGGPVFPINAKRSHVLGIKAYPTIADTPDPVDLAIVVTPAETVPQVIGQCADARIPGAVIISAGFKEIGEQGAALERQVLKEAVRGQMRVIGPNCLGVMNTVSGLNATFASAMARPGPVGFISQSGALCTSILDWSFRERVGFSVFASVGSMLDVGWGDLIEYLGDDPHTKSIVIYMESIGDARSFMSAAREVAFTKPIIVIKPGRTAAAAKAAASHTGAMAGSDDVFEAAMRRAGVLRVHRISELFNMSEVLAKQPRPKGKRLAIVTNAGGPGVLATDMLISGGGELAELSDATRAELDAVLPAHWSHNNPIDVLGDAGPDRYRQALEIVAKEPNCDGVLAILTPQAMTDATRTAEELKRFRERLDKPLIASWMGGADVAAGEAILNQADIPSFSYPDTAAETFNYMWRFAHNLRQLYDTPQLAAADEDQLNTSEAAALVAGARRAGRRLLTEYESKRLLACYGIPTVETVLAASEQEAIAAARKIGFPVAMKLHSETITHKTDVGGVKLRLGSAEEVAAAWRHIEDAVKTKAGPEHFLGVTVQKMISLPDAYELIVGSSPDPQFGPVILFGAGGVLVEVFRDRALALPPLTTTLARRLMERTQIFRALSGIRGRSPVDLPALERLLTRFSFLVNDQPSIREIDINPLLASPEGLIALDARVVLYDANTPESEFPRPAIRPYPTKYIHQWRLNNGVEVRIRPIRPDDEPLMVRFHETLSESSVYMRYFHALKLSQRVGHERLTRICFIDYDREMALVAVERSPEPRIVGVGRLSKRPGGGAEFAILITDSHQRQGLGGELLRRLVEFGKEEGDIHRIYADILPANTGMQRVASKLGFSLHTKDNVVRAVLDVATGGS